MLMLKENKSKMKKILLWLVCLLLLPFLLLNFSPTRQLIIEYTYYYLYKSPKPIPVKLNEDSNHIIEYHAFFNINYCLSVNYYFDENYYNSLNNYVESKIIKKRFIKYYLSDVKNPKNESIHSIEVVPEYYKIRLKVFKNSIEEENLVYDNTYSNYSKLTYGFSDMIEQNMPDKDHFLADILCPELNIGKYYFEVDIIKASGNNKSIFQTVETDFYISPYFRWK